MNVRVARKVVARWKSGIGDYTDRQFHTVIAAVQKFVSYETRRGRKPEARILPAPWKDVP